MSAPYVLPLPDHGRRTASWLLLSGSIAMEVVATSLLPATEGFSRVGPSAIVIALYAATYLLLSRCLQWIPLGVAYAVWSGLGTAIVAAMGVLLWGEAITVLKVVGILLIIVGVVAINLPPKSTTQTDTKIRKE